MTVKKTSEPKVKQRTLSNLTKDDISLDQNIPMYISDPVVFEKTIRRLSLDEQKNYLAKMRDEKTFQSKILQEDWRARNPNSFRYVQAEKIIDILNQNGKILKSLIDKQP